MMPVSSSLHRIGKKKTNLSSKFVAHFFQEAFLWFLFRTSGFHSLTNCSSSIIPCNLPEGRIPRISWNHDSLRTSRIWDDTLRNWLWNISIFELLIPSTTGSCSEDEIFDGSFNFFIMWIFHGCTRFRNLLFESFRQSYVKPRRKRADSSASENEWIISRRKRLKKLTLRFQQSGEWRANELPIRHPPFRWSISPSSWMPSSWKLRLSSSKVVRLWWCSNNPEPNDKKLEIESLHDFHNPDM